MNVRLQYDLEFLGGIYFEEQLQMNHYSVSLNLVTGTSDPADTNIAMDRVKAFVFGELEHSVFMNAAQRERARSGAVRPELRVDRAVGAQRHVARGPRFDRVGRSEHRWPSVRVHGRGCRAGLIRRRAVGDDRVQWGAAARTHERGPNGGAC